MTRFMIVIAMFLVCAPSAMAGNVSNHLRVRVTLDNGARLVGVVRNGALYEMMAGDGKFVAAENPRAPRCGFRLWHVADSPGYLWVLHRDVKNFQQLALMSNKELYDMQRGLRRRAEVIVLPQHPGRGDEEEEADEAKPSKEDEEAERAPKIGPELPPDAGDEPVPGDEPKDEASDEPETPKSPGELLLEKFPPHAGWLPERRDEIERRKWVLGVFPTPEEKEFIESYSVWKPAYDEWLKDLIRRQAEDGF